MPGEDLKLGALTEAERQAAAQCVARLGEIDLELAPLNGEGVISRKKLALQKE